MRNVAKKKAKHSTRPNEFILISTVCICRSVCGLTCGRVIRYPLKFVSFIYGRCPFTHTHTHTHTHGHQPTIDIVSYCFFFFFFCSVIYGKFLFFLLSHQNQIKVDNCIVYCHVGDRIISNISMHAYLITPFDPLAGYFFPPSNFILLVKF